MPLKMRYRQNVLMSRLETECKGIGGQQGLWRIIDPGLLFLVFRTVVTVVIPATVFSVSSFRVVVGVRKLPAFDTDSSFFSAVRFRVIH